MVFLLTTICLRAAFHYCNNQHMIHTNPLMQLTAILVQHSCYQRYVINVLPFYLFHQVVLTEINILIGFKCR